MKVPKPRKLKSGSWFIQMRLNGVSVSVTERSKTECIKKAELIKAEHAVGKRIHKEKSSRTLSDVVLQYIKSREGVVSPSTVKGYQSIADNRFTAFMDKNVSDINWQEMINDEVSRGLSAKTVKNSWSLVESALNHSEIATPTVKLPKIMPSVRPWLNDDQIQRFVKYIKGEDCEIPALLALHSLRRSEILAITWDKIDLNRMTITVDESAVMDVNNNLVVKKTTKTAKSKRTIPIMIPELAVAIKKKRPVEGTGRIVTQYPNTMYKQINRICRQNGLPEVGVHGLRHSFASLAHHLGMPEKQAMLIGGWEDAQTMHKIYTHISERDLTRATNAMARFYNQNRHR